MSPKKFLQTHLVTPTPLRSRLNFLRSLRESTYFRSCPWHMVWFLHSLPALEGREGTRKWTTSPRLVHVAQDHNRSITSKLMEKLSSSFQRPTNIFWAPACTRQCTRSWGHRCDQQRHGPMLLWRVQSRSVGRLSVGSCSNGLCSHPGDQQSAMAFTAEIRTSSLEEDPWEFQARDCLFSTDLSQDWLHCNKLDTSCVCAACYGKNLLFRKWFLAEHSRAIWILRLSE